MAADLQVVCRRNGRGDGRLRKRAVDAVVPVPCPGLIRLHAPFTTENEINKIAEFLKAQESVVYDERFLIENEGAKQEGGIINPQNIVLDELYDEYKEYPFHLISF